jgi:lysophospholipase L1-like esterase
MLIFEKGDRLVFAGDSVTDMGSTTPVGEGLFDALGQGYVRTIENLLSACYPEIVLRVTNSGISGNTSRDLLARWDRDVVALNPDWVSICIGINDVWRQFDCPAMPDWWVLPEEYEADLREMLASLKGKVKGVFLMTPYYMEPNRGDPMRARMDEYGAIVKKLAEKYGCTFVDLQSAWDALFMHMHPCNIAWDRIHPNQTGCMYIAKQFLKAVGADRA